MYGTRTYPQILCFLGQLSFLAVVQLCQVSVQQISIDQRNPTSGHYQHQGAPCRPFLKEKSASGAYEEIFTRGWGMREISVTGFPPSGYTCARATKKDVRRSAIMKTVFVLVLSLALCYASAQWSASTEEQKLRYIVRATRSWIIFWLLPIPFKRNVLSSLGTLSSPSKKRMRDRLLSLKSSSHPVRDDLRKKRRTKRALTSSMPVDVQPAPTRSAQSSKLWNLLMVMQSEDDTTQAAIAAFLLIQKTGTT